MKYVFMTMVLCMALFGCTEQQQGQALQAELQIASTLGAVNQQIADMKSGKIVVDANIPVVVAGQQIANEGRTLYDNYKENPTQSTLALVLAAMGGFYTAKKKE